MVSAADTAILPELPELQSLYDRTPEEIEEDNKKIITYLALERLYSQIKKKDGTAIVQLKGLIKKQPGLVNADILRDLFSVPDSFFEEAYDTMVEFVVHRSDLIDEPFVSRLISHLNKNFCCRYHRCFAALILD